MTKQSSRNKVAMSRNDRDYTVLRQASVCPAKVKLSVVIPNYNTAAFIATAVESVLKQTFSLLEVIVVDDGSTDTSVARLLAISDPRLTCVRQVNKGLASARNTGILLSRGAYIGFLDSDDVWFRHKAETHLAIHNSDPMVGLTYSFSAYMFEDGRRTGEILTSRIQRPSTLDLVYRNHVGNGSTPIVNRVCFLRSGLFDETLRYAEDIEMWIRISLLSGLRIERVPYILTGYRIRQGSLTSSVERAIPDAELLVQCFRRLLPQLSDRQANRAFAQTLRVASRKAFSNGNTKSSWLLLRTAWQRSPMLPFYDWKALALILMNLLCLVVPPKLLAVLCSSVHSLARLRWPKVKATLTYL